jgi:CheY-like chemotaxis protein
MTSALPAVLLVDPATRDRLRVVAALTGTADVRTPEPSDQPVRLVRHQHFDLVLVALPRLAARRGLTLCRTLKTDKAKPPPVGLLDPWRRLGDVPGALEESLADGYLGGQASPSDYADFLADLLAGNRPLHTFPSPQRSLWGRIRGGF